MALQKLRIKRFNKSTPPQLVAAVTVNVDFNFDGLTPEQVIAIASGGQSPRVRYQDSCRADLTLDEFIRLDGTTQTVSVMELYSTARKRTQKGIEDLFAALNDDRRAAFIEWAMAQPSSAV